MREFKSVLGNEQVARSVPEWTWGTTHAGSAQKTSGWMLDYAIPIVAILVIAFSLGSIFYDPAFNLRPNRSDLLKTYAPKPKPALDDPKG